MTYATLHHRFGTTPIPRRAHLQAAKLAADYHARHGPAWITLEPTGTVIYRGRDRFKPAYQERPPPDHSNP